MVLQRGCNWINRSGGSRWNSSIPQCLIQVRGKRLVNKDLPGWLQGAGVFPFTAVSDGQGCVLETQVDAPKQVLVRIAAGQQQVNAAYADANQSADLE